MLHIIHSPVPSPQPALPAIAVRADRFTLAKRRWRAVADDGVEFGFELEVPLKHGDTVFESPAGRYHIVQAEEPVVEIQLSMPPSAAAGVGWAIGNLHLELSAEPHRLLAADDAAVRQLLARLDVPYRQTSAIFRPGRFARGTLSTHELGPGHRH